MKSNRLIFLVFESKKKPDHLLFISRAKQKVCLFMGKDLINIFQQVNVVLD